jgi:uncharacterized SAM-binding protein YcdF (DUF218 family)
LAKAFSLNPDLLFVSEPTRGIDVGAKAIVLETLRRYNREKGATIVMVSSELEELRSVCDRVAIVSGGKGAGENITEAQAMHDWLIANGIPEERILMEDKATSTMENLEYSFAIIRERGDEPENNVAIVSSAYHLYRAKLMSRNLFSCHSYLLTNVNVDAISLLS